MTERRDLDPFALSRSLEKAAERFELFRAGLVLAPAVHDPFLGQLFPGKSHYDEVCDLSESDPLRAPLLRWVHALLEARLQVSWISKEADLEFRSLHPTKDPRDGVFSLAQMRHFALSGDEGSAPLWWRNVSRYEGTLAAHRLQMAVRREEIAERLGCPSVTAFFSPVTDDAALVALARRTLQETNDLAEDQIGSGWSSLVEAAAARGASEGWPGRLSPDTLRDLLGERELFRGLTIRPGALPERLCPMSFPRAAVAVGRALHGALLPSDLPFVVAHDVAHLRREEVGALLGWWVTSEAFLRVKLGLSRDQRQEMMRHLKPALLAHLRLAAARVLTRDLAGRGPAATEAEFPQISCALLGHELSPSAALGRFRAAEDSSVRFVALLSAWVWADELTEEYDEDWYRNPRAQESLREAVRIPGALRRELPRCEAGMEALVRRLR